MKHLLKTFTENAAGLVLFVSILFFIPSLLKAEELTVEEEFQNTPAESETIQLAQSRRRRPGTEAPKRRERKAPDSERIPAATTPEQAERQKELYLEAETPVPPTSSEFFKVENRWDMLYQGKWYDPYNQNILKGDIPVFGPQDSPWFFDLTAMSDTLVEQRAVPAPVAITSSGEPRNGVFGDYDQTAFVENLLFQASLIHGNTTFKPPDFELRIAPVIQTNTVNVDETGVLFADPAAGTHRDYTQFSLATAFADVHLGNISERYDFVSVRAGVQPFNSDFKGFILNESQPGIRFFGNYDNNQVQWNAAWFYRLKNDVNTGLPVLFESRHENVYVGNAYFQDLIALGHTVGFSYIYRDDTFGDYGDSYDENGFLTNPAPIGDERPKNVRNSYFGVSSEGHIDRINISSAAYYAYGSESHNPIAGQQVDISAFLGALELSIDLDWLRPHIGALWASGDDDPNDDKAEGFDAIFDNPNFAGGNTSYWTRQGVPLIGGGGVQLTSRLSPLTSLRAGKDQGQSNFVNPGVLIYNTGLDVDLTPKAILLTNASYLTFDDTAVLEKARQDGSIDKEIGFDLSTAIRYRPLLSNNIQITTGAAWLFPGSGLKDLYGDKTLYQVFTNLVLMY